MGFFRPTYAEVDLGALEHNYKAAKKLVPRGAGIMAMVKADAYGHGAAQVSRRLEALGIASLGVATVEEGLELRESGIRSPVIVMGGLMGMGSPASGMMIGADLTPVVHSADVLDFLESVAKAARKTIGIHLKIDTGMGRLGALPGAAARICNEIKGSPHIRLDGVMTHFADAEDEEYTGWQIRRFNEAVAKIEAVLGPVRIRHMSNSAALMGKRRDRRECWVRPGIMLYGAHPFSSSHNSVRSKPLLPVMSLKSSVVLIKAVPEGSHISYGRTYKTRRKTRLGVIPIGYADGYPLALSNRSSVLVGGRRVPVIGRVTMDMIMVDLTDVTAHVGSEAVLLGRQGKEEIAVGELSSLADTIPYEFFCGISKRMPRVYLE